MESKGFLILFSQGSKSKPCFKPSAKFTRHVYETLDQVMVVIFGLQDGQWLRCPKRSLDWEGQQLALSILQMQNDVTLQK